MAAMAINVADGTKAWARTVSGFNQYATALTPDKSLYLFAGSTTPANSYSWCLITVATGALYGTTCPLVSAGGAVYVTSGEFISNT